MTSVAAITTSLLAVLVLTDVNEAQYRRGQYNFNNNNFNNNNAASARLYIFTSQTHFEIVYGDLNSLAVAGFDANKPTKIIVHGWRGNVWDEFTYTLANAYLSAMDVNVIGMDYSRLAQSQYQSAVAGVHGLGRQVAQVLDWMATDAGVSLDSVHLMGYSLGSHVAGAVGEHVSAGKIGRITGLDSAGPGFGAATSGRLDASDAQFVDAIHTCAPFIGMMSAHGHADFYVNGGTHQPGCSSRDNGCSHQRSYLLFAESISGSQFVSRACNSWQNFVNGRCDSNPTTAVMGEHIDTSARGEFYLHTAARSPYALG